MVIGVRKVFAPESRISLWPMGNGKYSFLSAQSFDSEYESWKTLQNERDSLIGARELSPGSAYIESARYYGNKSESGELAGWGEWKVNTKQGTYNSKLYSALNASVQTSQSRCFLILPPVKLLITDWEFITDAGVQATSDLLAASLPNGSAILFVPAKGTVRFHWKAQRGANNDYRLQAVTGLESLWSIDIPADEELSILPNASAGAESFLCADVKQSKNKDGSKKYSIRWSEPQTVIIHIASENEKTAQKECQYVQKNVYSFAPGHFDIRSEFKFDLASDSQFPVEIPFTAVHSPEVVWTAFLDDQPADVRYTDSGAVVDLRKCKLVSSTPTLTLSAQRPFDKAIIQKEQAESSPDSSAWFLTLPRIKLLSQRWQNGSAVITSPFEPLTVSAGEGASAIETVRTPNRQYQTSVELNSPDADVAVAFDPTKELFYSNVKTSVQWEGSQALFNQTIELEAVQGSLYELTAPTPDGLTIDNAAFLDQPDVLDDWSVEPDPLNPAKRILKIYLRKSLAPGRNLTLNVESHIIADWGEPVELNRFEPLKFNRIEPRKETLFVNVAPNEKFVIGDRVMYSPEQNLTLKTPPTAPAERSLPVGIERASRMTPDSSRVTSYEFCIDLKKWGDYKATLQPIEGKYDVDANVVIWVNQHSLDESIELVFSSERSYLNQFRFSYGADSDETADWNAVLTCADDSYKVTVERVEKNVYSIAIPKNVSSPFTINLSRQVKWSKERVFEIVESVDCSHLFGRVKVYSSLPRAFDATAPEMKSVPLLNDKLNDYSIGSFEYERVNRPGGAADSTEIPTIKIYAVIDPINNNSIWAWNQIIDERRFASGAVLTSALWTIENRFPPQEEIQAQDSSNIRLKLTLPTSSVKNKSAESKTFLTGVRIDNEIVNGEYIIQESENVYTILLPSNRKIFTLAVQWTSYDHSLRAWDSIEPQKPQLNIPVFKSVWNLCYPKSWRRLNSYSSSDIAVDGWRERLFGSLICHDLSPFLKMFSQLWDEKNDEEEIEPEDSELNRSDIAPIPAVSDNKPFLFAGSFASRAWNSCRFETKEELSTIYIVRSETSECIRWVFFIATISLIFMFYFKRNIETVFEKRFSTGDSDSLTIIANGERTNVGVQQKKFKLPNWGIRRCVGVVVIVCGIFCETLPWFVTLPFSGIFLGGLVSLLVLVGEPSSRKDSSSVYKTQTQPGSGSLSTRITLWTFLVLTLVTIGAAIGQTPVLPPPMNMDSNPFGGEEKNEFDIFVPLDSQNNPKKGYYVPQELLELIHDKSSFTTDRSWVICRAEYSGKLIQRLYKTETDDWKCTLEIETLVPNVFFQLPDRLQRTLLSASEISVSRGRLLRANIAPSEKPAAPSDAPDQTAPQTESSESLYWSWEKLSPDVMSQFGYRNNALGIRLPQPGRYRIEADFHPAIEVVNGKNEISFPIVDCLNSTFELTAPETITGLEFPEIYGAVEEVPQTRELKDPSVSVPVRNVVKKVNLGAMQKLVVRWNEGGTLSDDPVFDVDSLTWWEVAPERVNVKIKYKVKVVSGSVSSIELKADEKLTLLNGAASEEDKSDIIKYPYPPIISSIAENPKRPGYYTVEFTRPINTQASFELDFRWKNVAGVGRLQFPTTSISNSRIGTRLLAFTFDPRLQYDCVTESLTQLSGQAFTEQWRANSEIAEPKNDARVNNGSANSNAGAANSNSGSATENDNSAVPANGETNAPKVPFTPESQSVPPVQPGKEESESKPAEQTTAPSVQPPTVAYDLNRSRRMTEGTGTGSIDSVMMNVQRVTPTSTASAEAYVLARQNRLLWQIKWNVVSSKGEWSGCTAEIPASLTALKNQLSITSATIVPKQEGKANKPLPISTFIHGSKLHLYWGVPIEAPCQIIVIGKLVADKSGVNLESNSNSGSESSSQPVQKFPFNFPLIDSMTITQFRLAVAREDDCLVKTSFEKATPESVAFTKSGISIESPFTGRNQRLLETWQTPLSDVSKKPVDIVLEAQKNVVDSQIDCTVEVKHNGSAQLTVKGRVTTTQGALDEILLEAPEICSAPVSTRTTLDCQLDADSISQGRYILRPQSPFAAESDFELSIPLKKDVKGQWQATVSKSDKYLVKLEHISEPETQTSEPTQKAETNKTSLKRFGMKVYVKPISDNEYYASAEFACYLSDNEFVQVKIPERSKIQDVQIQGKSTFWKLKENSAQTILIPVNVQNALVNIRIIYSTTLHRRLFSEPVKFIPPVIENSNEHPDIIWIVLPWKELGRIGNANVRPTSFSNALSWIINNLNNELQFLRQEGRTSDDVAIQQLEKQLVVIERKLSEEIKASNAIGAREKESFRKLQEELAILNYPLAIINHQAPIIGIGNSESVFELAPVMPPPIKTGSVWQALTLLAAPILIWLVFFPPEWFLPWRPSFVLGCLSVLWGLWFNLYGIAVILAIVAIIDFLRKLRQFSQPNIIPLRVR